MSWRACHSISSGAHVRGERQSCKAGLWLNAEERLVLHGSTKPIGPCTHMQRSAQSCKQGRDCIVAKTTRCMHAFQARQQNQGAEILSHGLHPPDHIASNAALRFLSQSARPARTQQKLAMSAMEYAPLPGPARYSRPSRAVSSTWRKHAQAWARPTCWLEVLQSVTCGKGGCVSRHGQAWLPPRGTRRTASQRKHIIWVAARLVHVRC